MRWIKRCLAALRRMSDRHVLSTLFLGLIFLVFFAAIPKGIGTIVTGLQAPKLDPRAVVKSFDGAYREMLDFYGPFPVNKGAYIDLNGLMARLLGQRMINNCVKLNNGHLAGYGGDADAVEQWPQIVKLCKRQEAAGKTFLFVLAPGQVSKYEPLMPAGVTSNYNQVGDAMLASLRSEGVPTLDLREVMHNQGMSNTDAFFAADLHWKPETGFWAFGQILADLYSKGVVSRVGSQYTDLSNYQIEVYKDWFLGSSGRRTGKYFAGVEDFSVITPKFDTHLVSEIPTRGIRNEGTFAQTALNWRWLFPKDYYGQDPYELYDYGNPDEIRYSNSTAPLPQKVLWLGDSFGSTVVPFMSLVFDSVEDLDMRSYKGDFAQFYQTYQPDIVIMLVTTAGVVQENTTAAYFPD